MIGESLEDLELGTVFFSDLLPLVAQKAALLLCDILKDSGVSIFKWVCLAADCRTKHSCLFLLNNTTEIIILRWQSFMESCLKNTWWTNFSCVFWSEKYQNNYIPKGFYGNNNSNDNNRRNIAPSAAPHFAGLIHVGISHLLFCV